MFVLFFLPQVYSLIIDFPSDMEYCCRYGAALENCHDNCLQIFKTKDENYLKVLRTHFPTNCPIESPDLIEFWDCLRPFSNDTRPATPFKQCCDLAVSDTCRSACVQGIGNETFGYNDCKEPYEEEYYSCLLKQDATKKCCKENPDVSSSCRHLCELTLRNDDGPNENEINRVASSCRRTMAECLRNYTNLLKSKSVEDSQCCELSSSSDCRKTCRQIFQVKTKDSAIIDHLVKECGDVVPHQPMWKCFLKQSEPAQNSGLLTDNLQCCLRARSLKCKQLCGQLYGNPWSDQTLWSLFERSCERNNQEGRMQQCLKEVSEPCQLGCSSLNFCEAFNNQPTTLFRQCTREADFSAKHHFESWSRGTINLPHISIPVKNISECEAEKWKAAACLLQIKPCSLKSGAAFICKSDCVALLNKCANKMFFDSGMKVEDLCESFSPSHLQDDCISLSTYVGIPKSKSIESKKDDVTQPCNPNPCDEDQVCVLERSDSTKGQRLHSCHPGCKINRDSKQMTTIGSLIRRPRFNRGEGCFKTCFCSSKGNFRGCKNLSCNDPTKQCLVQGKTKNHGSQFFIDCNFCTCFSGEVVCTNHLCFQFNNISNTGQQCKEEINMDDHCNATEETCLHSNEEVANCLYIRSNPSLANRRNSETNPCDPHPCKLSERCVPTFSSCLTQVDNCKQYECLPEYRSCMRLLTSSTSWPEKFKNRNQKRRPYKRISSSSFFFSDLVRTSNFQTVCDSQGVEHENICELTKNSENLFSYHGKCLKNCGYSYSDGVCGYDRSNYENRCRAETNLVLVDHNGPCQINSDSKSSCENVSCLPLKDKTCNVIQPFESCCPICGAMMQVLLHDKALRSISKSLWRGPVTVRDIILQLQQEVQVFKCRVYGHVISRNELSIFFVSGDTGERFSKTPKEACLKEAERISILINQRSPTFSSRLFLSSLVSARLTDSANAATRTGSIFYFNSFFFIISFYLTL